MPKCAVWSCKNSSSNIRKSSKISFFHYPRDQLLASRWWAVLAPVVTDSFKATTAIVCSDHFQRCHTYFCNSKLQILRNAVPDLQLLGPVNALRESYKMPPQHDPFDHVESPDYETNMIMDVPEILKLPSELTVCRICLVTEGRMKRVTEDNFEEVYLQVTGLKWNKEDKLPQHLCWECSHRLQSAAKFKRKALSTHCMLHKIRNNRNYLTMNDVKLIDRKSYALVSSLSKKRFPTNEYLSDTTINNNKIFPQETKLEKCLNSDPGINSSNKAKEFVPLVNLGTIAEQTQVMQRDLKLEINPRNCSITVSFKTSNNTVENLNRANNEPEDLTIRNNNKGNNTDFNLDAYRKNGKESNLVAHKNTQSPITNSNTNPKSDSYLSAYKNVGTTIEKIKVADIYNMSPTGKAPVLASYLTLDGTSCLNPNANTNNLDSSRDMPDLDIAEPAETGLVPKKTDASYKYDDDYDSDESDILVIDADVDNTTNNTTETVTKDEYVAAGDKGMVIDDLIDIYNNDGDGDGRLQELNDRFGDGVTVKIERGCGTQKQEERTSRPKPIPLETDTERLRRIVVKPVDVLRASVISPAYEKLNQELFTLTPVSEAEQIAEIAKRQETLRFKRARFKCHQCFRGFLHQKPYDTHMLRHDEVNGAFECSVCKFRQKSRRAMKTHMYGLHTVKITCNGCNFVTMSRSVARGHEKWHAGTIYKCPHCPVEFDQESTYKCHLRTRHVHAFACALCGLTFISLKGLAVHRCKRHADADQIPLLGPYCAECKIRFVAEDAYTRHLQLSSLHHINNSPARFWN